MNILQFISKSTQHKIALFVMAGLLIFTITTQVKAQATTHPFLIVKDINYTELQNRALQSPWKEMKTRAINDVTNLIYNPQDPIAIKSNRMRDIVSAGALAYIIDPANRILYKDKIRDTLAYWNDIYPSLDSSQWNNTVPPGSAFLNSVLALDIIYNDLTVEERTTIEIQLDTVAEWYWANNSSWLENLYAVRGIWALYQGDRTRIDIAKQDYRNAVIGELTSDGVFHQGPGYAWARLGSNEDSKSYFMDILEFTQEDSYYSNPQIRGFFEWLYGGSILPFRQKLTFGDSAAEFYSTTSYVQPAALRAQRFSSQAGENASWLINNVIPQGRLLSYLLMDQPLLTAKKPLSYIWPSGSAVFWEDNPSDLSLMGALWNTKVSGGHSHKDVNAIHIAAYGENVLRNVGYPGWGNSCLGFPWSYVHDNTISSNTVTIDKIDHKLKQGGGISEGFTDSMFDYASGDSGNALSNGKHQRNFVFVHPQDGTNGYFVLFDEIKANTRRVHDVNIVFHPGSATYSQILSNQEYEWVINKASGHDVFSTIFLGTAPESVIVKDGVTCTNVSNFQSVPTKFLYSSYKTDNSGLRNVVTVLFPHDSTHSKAIFSRISGNSSGKLYSGVQINLNVSTTDTALESLNDGTISYLGISFKGWASLYRKISGGIVSYYVRKGTSFNDGGNPRKGFQSDSDISLYLKEKQGSIVSPGTNVTFYHPNVKGVILDGFLLPLLNSGSDWVKVNIMSGRHSIELVTN